jgi:serine/threonine protein kinase
MSDDSVFQVWHSDSSYPYELIRRIGGGATGEVWHGSWSDQDGTARAIAVKISRGSGHRDEQAWWEQWGTALSNLDHPALARVIAAFVARAPRRGGDAPSPGVFRYLVMDYVAGTPMDDWVRERVSLSSADRVALLQPIASALDELHSGSRTGFTVGHGDVKPANILVRADGTPMLVDLGRSEYSDPARSDSTVYLSPEVRAPGTQPSPGADAYALAVTLTQLLLGHAPPTDASGFLDLAALDQQMRTAEQLHESPQLVDGVMRLLASRDQTQPGLLVGWLDTLAQSAVGARSLDEATPLTLAPAGDAVTSGASNAAAASAPGAGLAADEPSGEDETALISTPGPPTSLSATAALSQPEPIEPPAASADPVAGTRLAGTSGEDSPPPSPWSKPSRWSKRNVWIGAAVLAVVLAGAGTTFALSSGKPHHEATAHGGATSTATPTRPTSTPTTDETTSAPAPSVSTPPSYGPGDTVLSDTQVSGACSGNGTPNTASTDSIGSGSSGPGQIDEILPDGTTLIDCSDENGTANSVAAVDAGTGSVIWTRDIPGTQASVDDGEGEQAVLLSGGGKYIYLLRVTDHPAVGLHDEFRTRSVTAIDAHSGTDVWTQPLEKADRTDSNVTGTVSEQASTTTGQASVIVNVDDYSAYDRATGKPMWERPDLSTSDSSNPLLAGYGRSLDVVQDDNGDDQVVCTDLASGKRVWTTPANSDNDSMTSDGYQELDGSTYWFFSDAGYDAYDLLSGKHNAHGDFPSSFQNTLATSRYTVAQVGSTLRLYRTGHYAQPVWSVASDGATPHIVTSRSVLVEASAGNQLLDATTGSLLQSDPSYTGSQSDVIDGFLPSDNNLVELGKS